MGARIRLFELRGGKSFCPGSGGSGEATGACGEFDGEIRIAECEFRETFPLLVHLPVRGGGQGGVRPRALPGDAIEDRTEAFGVHVGSAARRGHLGRDPVVDGEDDGFAAGVESSRVHVAAQLTFVQTSQQVNAAKQGMVIARFDSTGL